MERRKFLSGLFKAGAILAAPAYIKADVLMLARNIIVPDPEPIAAPQLDIAVQDYVFWAVDEVSQLWQEREFSKYVEREARRGLRYRDFVNLPIDYTNKSHSVATEPFHWNLYGDDAAKVQAATRESASTRPVTYNDMQRLGRELRRAGVPRHAS